ncbi:sialate O-acetylesterase [Haloferula sp. A504]|uniref:sialate O-acetylesterase n=1 Tax=Haloferula sp. A504 TaxID=3373601 RepID=UPI0031BC1C39|nr:sialate O-acetylesterase [Verrucomicrobiaceae bacterium E54]
MNSARTLAVLTLLLTSGGLPAQISRENSDSFPGLSGSYPLTGLVGFDATGATKLVATISDEDGFGDSLPTGLTFDSVPMTPVITANNGIQHTWIYYLDASAVPGGAFGVGDLVVLGSGSNDLAGSLFAFSGTADGAGASASSPTQSVDLTTTADGSVVVAAHANNGGGATAQAPLTPLLDGDAGSAGGGSGHAIVGPAGTGAYSFTGSNSRPVTIAAEFVAGGAAVTPELRLTITSSGAGFDFSWPSQSGKLYDLVSSTNLSTAPTTWAVYDDGAETYGDLSATLPTNTLTDVAGDGPRRFFSIIEKDSPVSAVETVRVFLVGGQSNADGRADPSALPTSPTDLQQPQDDIDFYYKVQNETAALTTLRPGLSETDGFGPSITFGRTLADQLGDGTTTRVALIKYANGGTNLASDWVAGGDATTSGDGPEYVTFQQTVTNGLAALATTYPDATIGIEGMIWLQGESDIQGGSSLWNAYETNLQNFLDDITATYGTTLPFVVIRLSDGQTALNATGLGVVRTAQETVADSDPLTDWVDTDGFGMKGDNLHFDAAGQQSIGSAAATTMLGLLP